MVIPMTLMVFTLTKYRMFAIGVSSQDKTKLDRVIDLDHHIRVLCEKLIY